MPHLVIEYSENIGQSLQQSGIMRQLYDAAVATGLFVDNSVKARTFSCSHYILPKGNMSFMHITFSLLEGRTEEQRQQLSDVLFNVVQKNHPDIDNVSVNICEMHKNTYRKT